jgi:hypothetical protein
VKISAPSLKLDLAVTQIVVRDGEPVVLCRVGVYDATAKLDGDDVVAALRSLMKPRVVFAILRLALRGKTRKNK